MKRTRFPLHALCAVFLLSVIAASCTRTAPPATPTASQNPNAVPAPKAEPANRTIQLKTEETARPALAARRERGMQALLSLDQKRRLMPEDYSIGALSDSVGTTAAEQREAAKALAQFLTALTQGRIEKKLLYPSQEISLSQSITYSLEKGHAPKWFRIGTVTVDAGEMRMNVRLFADAGAAQGQVYLLRWESQWVVSDFQINLEDLAEARAKRTEKFFPSSYNWVLER